MGHVLFSNRPFMKSSGWDQEAGEIPVGGAHPARQPLGGQGMIGRRADEVEPQGLDEPCLRHDSPLDRPTRRTRNAR